MQYNTHNATPLPGVQAFLSGNTTAVFTIVWKGSRVSFHSWARPQNTWICMGDIVLVFFGSIIAHREWNAGAWWATHARTPKRSRGRPWRACSRSLAIPLFGGKPIVHDFSILPRFSPVGFSPKIAGTRPAAIQFGNCLSSHTQKKEKTIGPS